MRSVFFLNRNPVCISRYSISYLRMRTWISERLTSTAKPRTRKTDFKKRTSVTVSMNGLPMIFSPQTHRTVLCFLIDLMTRFREGINNNHKSRTQQTAESLPPRASTLAEQMLKLGSFVSTSQRSGISALCLVKAFLEMGARAWERVVPSSLRETLFSSRNFEAYEDLEDRIFKFPCRYGGWRMDFVRTLWYRYLPIGLCTRRSLAVGADIDSHRDDVALLMSLRLGLPVTTVRNQSGNATACVS